MSPVQTLVGTQPPAKGPRTAVIVGGSGRGPSLMRVRRPGAPGNLVPPIVGEVLASPGRPLEASTRSILQARYGHDFRRVRIHTDERAAASADAVGALAYTVGHDVVFGPGRYQPETAEGHRLLAHELAHVVQQGGDAAGRSGPIKLGKPDDPAELEADPGPARPTCGDGERVVRRRVSPDMPKIKSRLTYGLFDWAITDQDAREVVDMLGKLNDADLRDTLAAMRSAGLLDRLYDNIAEEDFKARAATLVRMREQSTWTSTTTSGQTTVTTTVSGTCSPESFQKISSASTQSLTWLDKAMSQIDAYLASPADAKTKPIGDAIKLHFKSLDPRVVGHVRGRLQRIRADIVGAVPFSIECHGAADPECRGAAAAYVPGADPNRIVFCSAYFDHAERFRIEAVIHEMAHAQVGGLHIADRGYEGERVYAYLTTEEALTNAESYGLLVEQLATGRLPAAPPKDTFEDCPGWEAPLARALAVAFRWNGAARNVLTTATPAGVAAWPPQRQQLLGGATQAAIDAALKAYAELEGRRGEGIDFECEQEGGGRCDRAATYWYMTGDLHVCPVWAKETPSNQAVDLLAGLYGYLGIVDDGARRVNYALLARALGEQAAPTLPEILGSQKWTPDLLEVSVSVTSPPLPGQRTFTESGSRHQRVSQALPVYSAPAGQHVVAFESSFWVDAIGGERPLPFTAPVLAVELHSPQPGGDAITTARDTRPRYDGAGSPLITALPKTFTMRPGAAGTLRMVLRLDDPDTAITRLFDDSITISIGTPTQPSPGPTP